MTRKNKLAKHHYMVKCKNQHTKVDIIINNVIIFVCLSINISPMETWWLNNVRQLGISLDWVPSTYGVASKSKFLKDLRATEIDKNFEPRFLTRAKWLTSFDFSSVRNQSFTIHTYDVDTEDTERRRVLDRSREITIWGQRYTEVGRYSNFERFPDSKYALLKKFSLLAEENRKIFILTLNNTVHLLVPKTTHVTVRQNWQQELGSVLWISKTAS